MTHVLESARIDPYAAQAGAAVVTATGSHSTYAGLCGEASGTGVEEAGVTDATLALLVVTLIAVLFAITFVLLCLHYKHNLRAAAEAQVVAERKRLRQRGSPYTSCETAAHVRVPLRRTPRAEARAGRRELRAAGDVREALNNDQLLQST